MGIVACGAAVAKFGAVQCMDIVFCVTCEAKELWCVEVAVHGSCGTIYNDFWYMGVAVRTSCGAWELQCLVVAIDVREYFHPERHGSTLRPTAS